MADVSTPAAVTTPVAAQDTATPAATTPAPAVVPAVTTPAPAAPQTGATALTTTTDEPAAQAEVKAVIPETYEIQAPEGMQLDPVAMEKFTPLLKELGASQEGAQKLVNFYADHLRAQTIQQTETWLAESKADPEIGGVKFDASAKDAQMAFAKYGNPQLKSFMESTGLGNHPAILKMFAKIGQASKEDGHVQLDTPSGKQVESMAKKWCPAMA